MLKRSLLIWTCHEKSVMMIQIHSWSPEDVKETTVGTIIYLRHLVSLRLCLKFGIFYHVQLLSQHYGM